MGEASIAFDRAAERGEKSKRKTKSKQTMMKTVTVA
jgi:hypothetical protein